MQALILAAGFGKRLQPLTNTIPKCLIEVNGNPLLLNALECLSGRNITEVLIVIGDKKEQIINRVGHQYREMKITYIENPKYRETNNVYSFWLSGNYIKDDLLMLECDLFYDKTLIDKIIVESKSACNILVSRYNSTTMDGTVVTVVRDNRISALTIKRDQKENFDYSDVAKTVNVYFFQKEFIIERFLPSIENYVKTQSVNSYYELVLGALIYYGNSDIRAVYIDESEWCEIDDVKDLERANVLFSNR
jgi:choline kinase